MAAHNVEFHDEAAAEYDAAFDWYAARSPEAASKFDRAVHHALQDIAANPQRWAIGPLGTRRYLLRKFPFLVVYREISPNYIQIVAIAHTSRKPWFWKGASKHASAKFPVLDSPISRAPLPTGL